MMWRSTAVLPVVAGPAQIDELHDSTSASCAVSLSPRRIFSRRRERSRRADQPEYSELMLLGVCGQHVRHGAALHDDAVVGEKRNARVVRHEDEDLAVLAQKLERSLNDECRRSPPRPEE
jgi:hypothetical protein